MKHRLQLFARLTALALLFIAITSAWAQGTQPATQPGVIPPAPEPAAHAPAAKQPNGPHTKTALILLDAEVDDMMKRSVVRRIDLARKAGCTLIIFGIDTYGGALTSALEICQLIKKLPGEGIHTAAWVKGNAMSAGSMLTYACEDVVMSSEGHTGSCVPIAVQHDWFGEDRQVPLTGEERAKFTAPILHEFEDSANKNGWNYSLLKAMVLSEIEIHEMQNPNTGEVRFVDNDGKDKLLNEEVDVAGGGKNKPWRYIKTIDDEKSILFFNGEEAQKMKLSRAIVQDETQLKGALNIPGNLTTFPFSFAENATVFLTGTFVRFLLFAGMLICIWLELSHPGVSIFGIGAVICLILLVGAPFLTGLAQVWEIALIVLGLLIIIADVLIFGGIGYLAIPGFILMAIGLVASFIPADPSGSFEGSLNLWQAMLRGMGVIVLGSFAALGAFYALAKYLYLTPGLNRLQLAPTGVAVAAAAAGEAAVRDAADRPAGDAVFLGAIGITQSDLRPSGKARFGDHIVAVVSHGGYIAQNIEVTIIEINGMRIVVKPHATRPDQPAPQGDSPEAGAFP